MPVPTMLIQLEIALPPEEDIRNFKLGRAIQKSLKAGHQAAGEFWQENILPTHFGAGAREKYRYAPRTPKYLANKAKWQGTQRWRKGPQGQAYPVTVVGGAADDNVFSGQLRKKMVEGRATFRAFATRVTVFLPFLPYIFKVNPATSRGRQPDKVREIAGTSSERDAQNLGLVFTRAFWRDWLGRLRKKRLTIDGTGRLSRIV